MLRPYASNFEKLWYWSHRSLCGLVLIFLMLPVLVIIPLSFNSGAFLVYPLQGFSLRWYETFFSSPEWMRALKNSLIVSPSATFVAMVFGTLASIGLTRAEFKGKALLTSILISPMVVPVVIVGVSVITSYSIHYTKLYDDIYQLNDEAQLFVPMRAFS